MNLNLNFEFWPVGYRPKPNRFPPVRLTLAGYREEQERSGRERTGRASSAAPAPRRRRRGTGQPRSVSAPPRAVAAGRASGAAPLLSAASEGWVSRASFLLLRAVAEAPRDRPAALHVLQCRLPEEHVPDASLQPRAPQPLHGNSATERMEKEKSRDRIDYRLHMS